MKTWGGEQRGEWPEPGSLCWVYDRVAWLPGLVLTKTGPDVYAVRMGGDRTLLKKKFELRPREAGAHTPQASAVERRND